MHQIPATEPHKSFLRALHTKEKPTTPMSHADTLLVGYYHQIYCAYESKVYSINRKNILKIFSFSAFFQL